MKTTSKTKKKSIANKITPTLTHLEKRAGQTLTYKEKGFVKDYVRTKNATESAIRNYNVKGRNVATAVGSQNLSKLHIRNEIVNLFNKQGLETDDVINIHKRNLLQDKHLGVSQSAVVDYYELTGIKKKEQDNNTTNIAFIINT